MRIAGRSSDFGIILALLFCAFPPFGSGFWGKRARHPLQRRNRSRFSQDSLFSFAVWTRAKAPYNYLIRQIYEIFLNDERVEIKKRNF